MIKAVFLQNVSRITWKLFPRKPMKMGKSSYLTATESRSKLQMEIHTLFEITNTLSIVQFQKFNPNPHGKILEKQF